MTLPLVPGGPEAAGHQVERVDAGALALQVGREDAQPDLVAVVPADARGELCFVNVLRSDLRSDRSRFDVFCWLLADELFARAQHAHLRGGLGVYRSTAAHGPFLHVDARGVRARWGLLP